MSGQEIQGFQVTATAGKGPGGGFTLWGWYGSKSSFEPYAKLFEGARMWGDIWKNNTEDYLVNPQPGEPVTRICPYGLKVVTEYEEKVQVYPPQKAQSGTKSGDDYDYVYLPSPDGTRLVYEHHVLENGEWKGFWFREFPDGSRYQYQPFDQQYPTKYDSNGNKIELGPWYRIDRIYKGPFDHPYWEVDFQWKADGSDRLDKITDSRGVEYAFTWDDALNRVTEILVSHPLQQWNGTPSSFLFKFQYDPQGRLTSVIYPQRQFTYDANHDLDYDAGEDYDACPAIGFAYDQAGGYTRITTVYNEIWAAGKSQSRLLQETLLSIGFDGTYPWLVTSETEVPGTSLERSHTFGYTGNPEGASGTLTWTEPMGVTRVYEWQEWPNVGADEGHPALKRSVVRVKRTPGPDDPRPANDPDHHGTLVWDLAWSYLKLTQVKGPYEEGKAPAQPLQIDWAYDSEGRNLPVSVSVTPEGGGTPLIRSWNWTAWGDPWAPWDASSGSKRKASRLERYEDAVNRVWTIDYTFATGNSSDPELVATITFPQVGGSSMTCRIEEDVLGRVVEMDEPVFDAWKGDPPNPLTQVQSKGVVDLTYGSDPSDPGYGLLSKVTLYRDSDAQANPSAPLDFTFKYTGLGFLEEMVAYSNIPGKTRTLKLVYL